MIQGWAHQRRGRCCPPALLYATAVLNRYYRVRAESDFTGAGLTIAWHADQEVHESPNAAGQLECEHHCDGKSVLWDTISKCPRVCCRVFGRY